MAFVIAASEITSCFFLLILLYGSIFESPVTEKKTVFMIFGIITTIIGCLIDAGSWLLEGQPNHSLALQILNILSYIFPLFTIAFFSSYIITTIDAIKPINPWHAKNILVICAVACILFIYSGCTGDFMSVSNNETTYGNLFPYIDILQMIALLYIALIILNNAEKLGSHDTTAMMSYIVLPFMAVIVEVYRPQYCFSYVATAMAITVMYVMIQSKHLSNALLKESIIREISNTDELTAVCNRHAYIERLKKQCDTHSVHIIFCNINNLRYTNQEYGHTVGDALIVNLAKILREDFHKHNVYRISGDEFVVILDTITPNEWKKKLRLFQNQMKNNADLAAYGFAEGKETDLKSIIAEAEQMMYHNKNEYYHLIERKKKTN